MKTSAAIIISLVMGALVTSAVVARGSDDQVAQPQTAEPQADQPQTSQPAVRSLPIQRAKLGRSAPARTETPTQITIPRLHLKTEIGTDLSNGPAWWPITGRPGGGDTIAVAGHRTTHTRPFYWLERVRPGDSIYIRWQGRVHAYRMSGRRILSAKNLHIADARGHELLLLTACTPRGSARQRIVVYAWPEAKTAGQKTAGQRS